MVKKKKIFLACFFVVVFVLALTIQDVKAFCIYNENPYSIRVQQTYGHQIGRGYSAILDPLTHGCVNWSEKSVNKEGKRTSTVRFTIDLIIPGWRVQHVRVCTRFAIKAGGWLVVTGGEATCEAHY